MRQVWLAFLAPEALHAIDGPGTPALLASIELRQPDHLGHTTALLAAGCVRLEARAEPTTKWHAVAIEPEGLDLCSPACVAEQVCGAGTLPLLLVSVAAGRARLYHWMSAGPAGSLFTAFAEVTCDGTASAVAAAIRACGPMLDRARPGLSASSWHTRWCQGLELERKFTFTHPVDPWRLNRTLHRALRAGAWSGFIPEFNEEFHVWDYESAMFEVTAPAESRGYVGIIPQADGRTTLKYKRFAEDCELRREDLHSDRIVAEADWETVARDLSGGTVRRLPGFRRKRFDCDLESLASGNAFGIFFDICRLIDRPAISMMQCEVEYLRTRSFSQHKDVESEFVTVCALTRDFLASEGCHFDEGFYSKLSFVRGHAAEAVA